jgi:hypothetical protein
LYRTLLNSERVEQLIYIHDNFERIRGKMTTYKLRKSDFEKDVEERTRLKSIPEEPEPEEDPDQEFPLVITGLPELAED